MTDLLTHTPAKRAMTIAVTSGKGGVGKTSVVLNLAVSLARLGQTIGVVDADFSLGNVDVLLGLTPERNLGHLLNGGAVVDEVVMTGPLGIQIVPASSGLRDLTTLGTVQWQRLTRALDTLARRVDFLIVDTAPGISDNVVDVACATDRVLIVTSLDPSAVVDAYAMVKVITSVDAGKKIGLLVNGVNDEREARAVYEQLEVAAQRFLSRGLEYFGFVPHDRAVREAVLSQTTVVQQLPHSPASRCYRALANRLSGLGSHGGPGLRLVSTRTKDSALPGVVAQRWA